MNRSLIFRSCNDLRNEKSFLKKSKNYYRRSFKKYIYRKIVNIKVNLVDFMYLYESFK